MARKTLVQMIDDVDGSVIKEGQGESIEFGIGGNQYRIDLNLKHANELHEQLAFWIEHAEKISGRRPRKTGAAPAPARGKVDLQDIRAWARKTATRSAPEVESARKFRPPTRLRTDRLPALICPLSSVSGSSVIEFDYRFRASAPSVR
uniref:histone-like nucleoid-structuring protein Lsr2 n=1 Tax=Rhodococcoides fascians TaxID=1828 RepID=UPI00366E4B31